MTKKKKQNVVHSNKRSFDTKEDAIRTTFRLAKQGIKTRWYQRGKKFYLTERFKGAKVLGLLEKIEQENKEEKIGN